jgi:SWI/SNF-related matrix-associated actin-dependent regulator 1 of chromatin subfamily A
MGIAKGKEWVLGLTGTPVVNKPIDLIPQLHIIQQLGVFGGYKGFVDRYCQGFNQASNLKELNYLMHQNCFYRREKQEVLKDLPAKMRNIVRVEITNRAEYVKAENQFIEYLRENLGKSEGEIDKSLRGEIMVQMSILKKVAARGKIAAFIDAVKEVVDAGEKIVLFAWHKDIVHEIKAQIPGSVTIVGDDAMDARQRSVDSFQKDPKVQVIICNIKSGGVGITLTSASRVSFIELPWHPADCEQCEDRCHRIGQQDSVEAKYFLGHQTIDEYIYQIIEKKRAIVNQVTGAEEMIETNVVDEFINLFRQDKF